MNAFMRGAVRRGFIGPFLSYLLVILGAIPLVMVVVTDFGDTVNNPPLGVDPNPQFWFAVGSLVVLYLANISKSRWTTVFLIVASITVSSRYLWWRLTETLEFDTVWEQFLGTGLFLAELYAWAVLVLGFLQTVWPLERRPAPMPKDVRRWPTIDIFVPTYNEPLDVVRNTVLAAQSMDYPRDKMRVYLLDDGRREEFRIFAEQAGVGYMVRPDNTHAKAGNLNAALARTDSEFVCIFDSDHVPTRAFLQAGMGWFDRDDNLALVQMPHHFYSPDPFERNLEGGESVPNEGQLFYGLLQEGNDLWNAAFFCGSCAILRRSAIEDIGGFAVETVTEDAHTALKLHRRGYNTAYLRLPLAAGLATERLALHLGQRMRWARGMTQIFRLDNPLLGRGLSLAQRLCYLNAMLHFFFALPRFVFLTAPLAYLLFAANIIDATALAILIFAAPHLFFSTVTNSRLQSRYRYSFWGEVYESVLAFYLLRPTLITLINPRRGEFNVTEKGGLLTRSYFDQHYVRPQLVVIAFLIAGLVIGILRLVLQDTALLPALRAEDVQVLALNMAWALFNLISLSAAVAVALERRQVRRHVRVKLRLPSVIELTNGQTIEAISEDFSIGGALYEAALPEGYALDSGVRIRTAVGDRSAAVGARVVSWDDGLLRVQFEPTTIEEQRQLVQIVFGRADAWLDWDDHAIDRIGRSAWALFKAIGAGVRGIMGSGRGRDADARGAPMPAVNEAESGRQRRRFGLGSRDRGPAPVAIIAGFLAATSLSVLMATDVLAQAAVQQAPTGQRTLAPPPPPPATGIGVLQRPGAVRTLPPPTTGSTAPVMPTVAPNVGTTAQQQIPQTLAPARQSDAPPAVTGPVPGQYGVPGQPAPPRGDSGSVLLTPQREATSPAARGGEAETRGSAAGQRLVQTIVPETGNQRVDIVTLEDMGARSPVRMEGVFDDASLPFTVRRDEVVTQARIRFNYAYSAALIPELSYMSVLINDEMVGQIQLTKDLAAGNVLDFPAESALFQQDNRIKFEFRGHYTLDCEDPLHTSLWSMVSNATAVEMLKERLPLRADLSLLPLPFFDERDMNPLALPFVLPANPTDGILKAAAIVASYFGREARFRGSSFPVSFNQVPEGNAVVLGVGGASPTSLQLPGSRGGQVMVAENPYDASGRLLILQGGTDEEIVAAAQTMALGAQGPMSGPVATVATPPLLVDRAPLDATYWIPIDRPVTLGEIIPNGDDKFLQGTGWVPGMLALDFRVPPGEYAWRDAGIPLNVKYAYPGVQWLDYNVSRLDVLINDRYVDTLPLDPDGQITEKVRDIVKTHDYVENEATIRLPPASVFPINQLQFVYEIQPYKQGKCIGTIPENVRTSILPESQVDFSSVVRTVSLPNLAYFANAGYPFTKYADLSETTVILPAQPAPQEIEAYLGLAGLMGESTGDPVVNMRVGRIDQVSEASNSDILIVGAFNNLSPQLSDWASNSQFVVEGNQIRVMQSSPIIDRFYNVFDLQRTYSELSEDRSSADEVLTTVGNDFSSLFSFLNPQNSDRTVVVATATTPEAVAALVDTVRSNDRVRFVQGDLVVYKGNQLSNFRVGRTKGIEAPPLTKRLRWYFADRPIVLLAILVFGVAIVAVGLYWLLRGIAAARLREQSAGA